MCVGVAYTNKASTNILVLTLIYIYFFACTWVNVLEGVQIARATR